MTHQTGCGIQDFRRCVEALDMENLSMNGVFFTWIQKRNNPESGVLKKMDRIIGNCHFLDKLSNAYDCFLPSSTFGHRPAMLKMKSHMRELNIKNGNVFDKMKVLREELKKVQMELDNDPGDHNSAYFHKVIKGRMSRSRIGAVNDEFDPKILFTKKLSNEDVVKMIKEVTEEEIESALFDINDDKASDMMDLPLSSSRPLGNKNKGRSCAFKVDIQKAYDTVNWNFLKFSLENFGFHPKMIKWIMKCHTTVSFSVSVNGESHVFFKAKKVLRQVMAFKKGKLRVRYLGVPLVAKNLCIKDCEILIDNVIKRVDDWQNKFLTFVGRLQLIASILSSMQVIGLPSLFSLLTSEKTRALEKETRELDVEKEKKEDSQRQLRRNIMERVDINTLTMEQYLSLTRGNQEPGVVKPKIRGNVNFEIKSQFMQELREDTFFGNKNDDAHEHVEWVLDIVSLFNIPGVTHDVVMLRVFPITLTESAKRWVDKLTSGIVNTWELFKNAFIQRYCPPSKTAKQLEKIYNFKQEGDETLHQAWESRFGGGVFGYSSRTDDQPSLCERRPSLTEIINKYMEETANTHAEQDEWLRKFYLNTKTNRENHDKIIQGFSKDEKQETEKAEVSEAVTTLDITPNVKQHHAEEAIVHETMESLSKIRINHPLLKEIMQKNNYAKHMKDLVANKPQTEEDDEVKMNPRLDFNNTLADLGASISVMPFSMYKRLGMGKLKPDNMVIEMAYNTKCTPKGIVENLLVKIEKFIFPVDFVILDMVEDFRMPIILGRPLLATAHAKGAWFTGTSEDEDDLEGIIDYLEPTSYDGFTNLDDKSYKERRCKLLGMTYRKPPPILIEKVEVTRTLFFYKDPIIESQEMSTSNTHQQSLADAGSETRPPILERGPYKFGIFTPSETEAPRMQKEEDLRGNDLKHYEAEIKAMNLILISIPNYIYNSMDACTTVKAIWQRVERLMRGTITLRTTCLGTTTNIQYYNCSEKGHYARNCPKPRVQDSKYFMKQMLLAKQDEAGVILTDEQNDFLFADASRMEEIKELSVNICLMARIQPENFDSDEGPSYDSTFLDEMSNQSLDFELQLHHEKERHKCESYLKNIYETSWISMMKDLESENVSLEFQVQSLIKERENVKTQYQKLFDSIKRTRTQTQGEINELIENVNKNTYAYVDVRAQNQDLLITISELKAKLKNVEKESMNIPSKEDLDNLFGPMYEEYFEKRSSDTHINSAAQQVYNHEDSPLTSLIVFEEHEAPPIVTTSEE
uniref:CCHC-type domain-containing protein n=1 Tax=Tanacetum cinerariifolium TaxID=118510 RepID=A0A6L2K7S2_TANCI|nr:hypothetical protein [Tanacetum cinerariifolium]